MVQKGYYHQSAKFYTGPGAFFPMGAKWAWIRGKFLGENSMSASILGGGGYVNLEPEILDEDLCRGKVYATSSVLSFNFNPM